ncbi:MAG TPA: hypothetical protein VIO58_01415 [Candidatus Methanoperedens sp.]
MKFAEKCPKCGGNVQTKSIKKSIGLGFVDIPVAQFCLNPACDWYQDFSESAKPEEIKENVIQVKLPSIRNKLPSPKFPQKNILVIGSVLAIIVIFLIFNSLSQPQSPQIPGSDDTKSTGRPGPLPVNTTQPSSAVSTPASPVAPVNGQTKPIKMDVGHGFNPAAVTIDRSDIVVWNDEENQRSRIVLISDDGLFENKLMTYPDKYYYQFNKSGNFNFSLAEYPSFKLYPNATGRVIVR